MDTHGVYREREDSTDDVAYGVFTNMIPSEGMDNVKHANAKKLAALARLLQEPL